MTQPPMRLAIPGYFFYMALRIAASSNCSPSPTLFLQLSNCAVPGTSVDSWGLSLALSTPPQYLCLVPSTVVNSTLVVSSEVCQNYTAGTIAQCKSLRRNTFNTSTAGSSFSSLSTNTILGSNPLWAEISPEPLTAGQTVLQLSPDSSLPNYTIGIIASGRGTSQNVGHLGLANDSDFLHAALSSGLIGDNGFGLNAGSQSIANPRPGVLVLGGYDHASINGAFSHFPISDASSSGKECLLQVTITQLVLRLQMLDGFADVELSEPGVSIPACIEP